MSHHEHQHEHDWKRLGSGKLITEDSEVGLGHIVSADVYKAVFASLIALTLITVWSASQDFGIFNLVIALGIATIKAAVVTLLFMHLLYESKIVWGIVIYPLFIFVLILGGTLGDQLVKRHPAVASDTPAVTAFAPAPAASEEHSHIR